MARRVSLTGRYNHVVPLYSLYLSSSTMSNPVTLPDAGNTLLFQFAGAESPFKTDPRYGVSVTAGVVPRRFHSHNDCECRGMSRGLKLEAAG